ncbi:MAG: methanethiol S-methyltransferase [Planctomycetota bacterium]
MKRVAVFAYGLMSYVMFLGVFVYSIGFLGNFGVPRSLDSAPQTPWLQALVVNCLLLGVFAIQHSGMARPAFKRWWKQWVPDPMERSTYVLFSNVAMIVLFILWEPIGGVVWNVQHPGIRGAIYAMYGLGWLTIFYSTCLLNHFELFGMRQVTLYLRGERYAPLKFDEPGLYRYVRHPLYVGWLMVFWFTPTMTIAHLLFALMCTGYILIAIQLEEHDLAQALPEYADYRVRVPMLVPSLKSQSLRGGQPVGLLRERNTASQS